jgi:hypothetical protein
MPSRSISSRNWLVLPTVWPVFSAQAFHEANRVVEAVTNPAIWSQQSAIQLAQLSSPAN